MSAPISLERRYALAGQLADAAREVTTRYFRGTLLVDGKEDASPVTVADREAEQTMRALITEACPEDGIVGEEFDPVSASNAFNWVLDPIDGTRSFISGVPWYGTLIGLLKDNSPVLGVIDMPMLNERWVGTGHGALMNGAPVHCREGVALSDAILFATDPDMFSGDEFTAFDRLANAVSNRRYGCDCYAYGLLAAGHIDLVVEASMKPYDALALVPVVEGAGGVITGWAGEPITMDWNGRVLAAATPGLHKQAMAILNG